MRKILKISLIVFLLFLIGLIGIEFAYFNFTRTGSNQKVIAGSLYLTLNESNDSINLTNALPESKEEARRRNDNTITFTLSGKNTSTNKQIHYEILLNKGEEVNNKERFSDKDLVFDLVEVGDNNEETIILDAVSYDTLQEQKIWVDKIDENTNQEIEKTYKLRMWLSDDIKISDTDPNADYTTDEYKNSYANVKVAVYGDLKEKELPLEVTTDNSFVRNGETYFLNKIENNEPVNSQDLFELTITSSNSNVQFKDNSGSTPVVSDSYIKTYTIGANQNTEFELSLITKDGRTSNTDLSFSLKKNGTVVQNMVKHLLVVGELKDGLRIVYVNKEATYSGNPVTLDNVTVNYSDGETAYTGPINYEYYLDSSCAGKKLSSAPVNAGNYSVKIIIPEGENNAPTSTCAQITINKAPTSVTIVNTGGVYNGSPIGVIPTSDFETETKYYSNNTCSNNEANIAPTNAGTYYVQATVIPDSNHITSKSECVAHQILGKPISEANLVNNTVTYTGTAQEPSVIVHDGNKTLVLGTDYDVVYSNNTNAGTGTATITLKGNYTGTITKTFTINKAVIDIPTSPSDKVYNGEVQQAGIVTPNNTSIVASGSIVSATNIGNYKVIYSLNDSSNYEWSDGTTTNKEVTWKIVAKDTHDLTVALPDEEYTYNGTAQEPNVTISDGSDTLVQGTDYTVAYSNNVNAGEATITITLKGNYTGTITRTFTIDKKEVTITADNKTMTYGGTAPSYTYTVTGAVGNENAVSGTATYIVKDGNTTVNDVTTKDVGTYTIIPSGLTAGSNYTITYANGTLTIDKQGIDFPSCTSKVYTGSSQELFVAHTSGQYINSAITGTAVNSYAGDLTPTSNYQWNSGSNVTGARTLTCQITKSDTTTILADQSFNFTGSVQEANGATSKLSSNNSTISGGNYNYTYYSGTSCGTALASAPTAVGNYSVKATLGGTSNYNGSTSGCAKYTIGSSLATCPSTITGYTGTYDGNGHTISIGTGASGGTVQYKIGENGTWSNDNSEIKNVEEKVIYVQVLGDGNHTTASCGNATIKINPKALTITAKAQAVQYGTAITTGTSQVTVSGLVENDTLDSITLTQNKTAVSTDGKITPSAAVIKNGSTTVTSNYDISYVQGNLTINKKNVTASISNCSSKTYDGTTSANCSLSVNGKVGNEAVTVSGTCTFADKNVGTGKTVTCTSLSLGGANASNYNLTTTSLTGSANITAKAITITAKNQTITYGGSITTGTNQVTVATLATGDSLTAITLTPSTTSPTTTGTITPSAATIKDSNGSGSAVTSNYSITYNTGTLTISNKTLTATISSCSNKAYDGTTTATCTLSLNGVETGDTVTVSGTCTFNNKNVGTSKAITCSSLTLGGTSASKYTLSTTSLTGSANITTKAITITAKDQTVNYGTAITTGTGQVTVATLATGDSLTAITLTPSTASPTATGTITPSAATIKDSNGSGSAVTSNYSITYSAGTLTINKKQLTPSITSCSNKEYDGTTSASCTFSLATPETGDTVTASGTCTFANASVGNNKTVTCSEIALSGADAGNYTVVSTATTTANITKKTLTPTVSSCNNKEYDGGTSATCTLDSLSGVISGETANLVLASGGSCTFANKNVGNSKIVTCSTLTINGINAGNYQLSSTSATTTANVTAKTVTVTAEDKSMDYGGNAPTYTYTVSGAIGSETAVSGMASYTIKSGNTTINNVSTANAGEYDIIPSGLTAESNYTITYVKGTLTINTISCEPPTNITINPDTNAVNWTNFVGADSYQISMSSSGPYSAHTNGAVYDSITSSTGSRTVYVRSVCNATNYSSDYSSANSKSTTIYGVTITIDPLKVSSVSINGESTLNKNFVTGATVTLTATPNTAYVWKNWIQTSGGLQVSMNNPYSATITSNWDYTANAIDVWAENLEYDATSSGLACEDIQCALDAIKNMLSS